MKHFLVFLGVITLVSLPLAVSAETVLRTGDSVSVSEDQSVENDFYALARTISMSGVINGDMYAVGGSVTSNGTVEEDLVIVGGSAQVHGEVKDDVRLVAGEAVVAEHVGGDVFVIGGSLKVLSTATIDGNIYFHGGEATIEGEVKGSLLGAAGSVRLDAPVAGDVDLTTSGALVLGDRAAIGGNLRHVGNKELTRGTNAVVVGDITEVPMEHQKTDDTKSRLATLFIGLFATLFMYLLFRQRLVSIFDDIVTHPGQVSLIGLSTVLGAPILTVFLLITVLGAALGVLVGLLLAFIFMLALILMSIVAGGLVAKLFSAKEPISLNWLLIGVVLVQLLTWLPVLGPFALFVLFVLTLGAVTNALYIALLR